MHHGQRERRPRCPFDKAQSTLKTASICSGWTVNSAPKSSLTTGRKITSTCSMIAELIINMYLQRREQEQVSSYERTRNWACQESAVHFATCGLKPQQSTAPSISCPSTFHLDAFNLLPRALKHRTVNGLRFLSRSTSSSLFFFFFRKLH